MDELLRMLTSKGRKALSLALGRSDEPPFLQHGFSLRVCHATGTAINIGDEQVMPMDEVHELWEHPASTVAWPFE